MNKSRPAARRAAVVRSPRARAVGLMVLAALLTSVAVGQAAAGPKGGDPQRDGPDDTPRGKRIGATEHPADLPEFWDESPRVGNPHQGEPIPNQYIVIFKPGTSSPKEKEREIAEQTGASVKFSYGAALHGFAAIIPEDRLDNVINHPNVESVEQDSVVGPEDIQSPATWGLDRIDQRDLPLNNSYNDFNEGVGVHAYIVDTGVRADHTEFTGRMGNGYDAITSGGTANDCNGHGTHVAGTVGGTTYGVADKVKIHPVRVLDCNGSGSYASVIAGVDWVRANAIKPAVANMSLGGGANSSLDTAVTNAVASGISFVVAAGNSNTNACNSSPSRVPTAITVGATTNTDARSSFSNYGTCLDLFAPGSSITSAWHNSNTGTNTISGTSMAAPHVAGAAAIYLAGNPTASSTAVRDALVNNSTLNKVTAAGTGSPNRLLFTSATSAPPPSPSPTPTTPPPTTGPNVIVNGGFENGSNGWTQSSSGGYNLIDSSKPRSGSYGVWALGYNSAVERITQTVVVPTNGSLKYYWHLTSSEGTTTAYDYMHVRVRSTTGTLLATVRSRSNTAARNVWTLDTISLATYAGQQVVVSFEFSSDSSITSSFYVDDVTLN